MFVTWSAVTKSTGGFGNLRRNLAHVKVKITLK